MENLIANIDLNQLKENAKIVLKKIPDHIKTIAVVKSNAYGHGAARVVRELLNCGISYFAVSDFEEAIAIREDGISAPILILSDIDKDHIEEAVKKNITISISDVATAEAVSRISRQHSLLTRLHVQVDTGMGRFGMEPDKLVSALKEINKLPDISMEGVFTHLSATFKEDEASNQYTISQVETFSSVLDKVQKENLLPDMVHIGSSTALTGFPQLITTGYFNTIRIGTLFLGYVERISDWQDLPIPIVTVQTHIQKIRHIPKGRFISYDRTYQTLSDIQMAILPVGYGHGLHRDLGSQGEVLINGKQAQICGKLTLGQTMVDVTHINGVTKGTPVILASKDLCACEQGKKLGRGTWEILLPLLAHSKCVYETLDLRLD